MESSVRYINDGLSERTLLIGRSTRSLESTNRHATESSGTYKSRCRSIRVMYLTMFLSSVSFSICMSSLYPYLRVLDPSADTDFLGWVVAAYSVGQLVASPFFGAWSNIRCRTREPLVVSIVINVLANVLYMYLESIQTSPQVYLLLARALVEFGAGNVAVVRSYVAGATHVYERISVMANLSAFQSAGFIFGNLFQTAMVPLGYPGPVHTLELHFDMYSATGLFSALVGIINILLLVLVFKEHNIVIDEEFISSDEGKQSTTKQKIQTESETSTNVILSKYSPDYVAVLATIFLFFSVLFIFAVFETIITPFGMDMFAWEKTKATLYVGIMLGCAGLVAIVVFIVIKLLTIRFNERNLLFVGFIICIFGYVSYLPWGSNYPAIQYAEIKHADKVTNNQRNLTELIQHMMLAGEETLPLSTTDSFTKDLNKINDILNEKENTSLNLPINIKENSDYVRNDFYQKLTQLNANTEKSPIDVMWNKSYIMKEIKKQAYWGNSSDLENEDVGCPYYFSWCTYTPATTLWQYLLGTFFISIGYPACSVISYTIFSKVLGPKPQGLWMGWLTAAGSLARTLGPVFVSQVYDAYGPRVAFTAMTANIFITLIILLIVYKRLVPFKVLSV
ncbi:major facilitator superfamily domain-containing protein 8-like [Ruditapes philippinarum]|uniref:major facilitator superfamily domain-containing protein 8-like n=1 Tax=Ruditapes philippinarum TaxID=129788 RepID=UPI00295AE624|nr:major facilitator superfamily domain-containing protein 8-like [Ruditapes philippinarum]